VRKIIVSIHSTLNGVVTGPADDPTNIGIWSQANVEDTGKDFAKNFETVDTLMLGRGTYEDLSTKWPEMKGNLADIINHLPKIIVDGEHRVENPTWGDFDAPTQLTGGDIEDQIRALKAQDGGDIITFGSPALVQSLTNAGLVDEYRIFIHPVVIGDDGHEGYKRLFQHIVGRKDLKLMGTQSFQHGAVLVRYELVQT
jgi:dihydrofolate reductase